MAKGFDLGGILQKAQDLQEKLASAQQELASRTFEASAGGGLVTAVVSGKLELVEVRIDPSLLEGHDVEMLQDLVVAAVNEAIRAAQKTMAEEMKQMVGPLGLLFPGMG